jgi:hypothetical protein
MKKKTQKNVVDLTLLNNQKKKVDSMVLHYQELIKEEKTLEKQFRDIREKRCQLKENVETEQSKLERLVKMFCRITDYGGIEVE